MRQIKGINFILPFLLFSATVLFSLSRTGMIIYLLYLLYIALIGNLSLKRILSISVVLICSYVVLVNLNISEINIVDRFSSSFDIEADKSTIERYGSAEAIYNLFLDKGLIFGVGIFNYGFYVNNYLPDYMDVITHYGPGHGVPSFNFILQLAAELGLPIFLIFMFASWLQLYRLNNGFVTNWFLFLVIFCLSFQGLNFSVPFLIILFPNYFEKNSLLSR
jgi:hypothetical protein